MTYRKLMKSVGYETYKVQEAQRVIRLMRPFPSIHKQLSIASEGAPAGQSVRVSVWVLSREFQ